MRASIRAARPDDAAAVGELARRFAEYLRGLGDPTDFRFDADAFRRDGFGPTRAFSGLVAELEGRVVGYLLHHPGYDADRAARVLHVVDLYVDEAERGRGVGRALMAAAAEAARELGAVELIWAVYLPNRLAARFYERLGARRVSDLEFMSLRA